VRRVNLVNRVQRANETYRVSWCRGEWGVSGGPGGRGESGEWGELDDGGTWILEPVKCAALEWFSLAVLPAPMPDHELAALAALREGEPFAHLEFGFAPSADSRAVRARERH
jgi:hypothetical protein